MSFDFTHQVKLVNIHRESVVDGNQMLVLGLIWAIIHHYQVNELNANLFPHKKSHQVLLEATSGPLMWGFPQQLTW